jgi:hypothetical protein
MLKNLPLIITAILVLSVAAIASVSALGEDTPTSTPTESPSPTNTAVPEETEAPQENPSPTATVVPSPTTDSEIDEAEDEGEEADVEDEASSGKQAAAIAAFCGKSVEEIEALHADGVGWGALFKVCKLSIATGESVGDILADAKENGFAFGNRFKGLTDEERARCDELPKNLGQAMKGQHDTGAENEADDTAESGQGDSQSSSKPNNSRGNGRARH